MRFRPHSAPAIGSAPIPRASIRTSSARPKPSQTASRLAQPSSPMPFLKHFRMASTVQPSAATRWLAPLVWRQSRRSRTKICWRRASTLGDRLRAGIEALDSDQIREVRGRGLMTGIDLRGRVTPVLRGLQDRGVLALPAGSLDPADAASAGHLRSPDRPGGRDVG